MLTLRGADAGCAAGKSREKTICTTAKVIAAFVVAGGAQLTLANTEIAACANKNRNEEDEEEEKNVHTIYSARNSKIYRFCSLYFYFTFILILYTIVLQVRHCTTPHSCHHAAAIKRGGCVPAHAQHVASNAAPRAIRLQNRVRRLSLLWALQSIWRFCNAMPFEANK